MQERSVVRPTYSYLGEFTISDKTVLQLIHYTWRSVRISGGGSEVRYQELAGRCGDQYRRRIFLRFFTAAEGAGAAESVAAEVERMTAFNILSVNIEIRGLRPEGAESPKTGREKMR